ncbi:MAG: hypothetical protein LBM65_02945 [Oscillospiraceae bacterium]|jgi:hypothetical protein|nr:hypothetical protein [Oscillospiraceae bacterium]
MSKLNFKKAVVLFLAAVILFVVFCVPASAADGKVYSIADTEVNFKITLPDNMLAATRDTPKSDPYFSEFELDYEQERSEFFDKNIYLQGGRTDESLSLTVTVTSDADSAEMLNYSYLETSKLNAILQNQLDYNIYTSGTVGHYGKNGEFVFLDFILETEQDGQTVYAASSNTVVNGMNIVFVFESKKGMLAEADYITIKGVLNSLQFERIVTPITENSAGNAAVWLLVIAILAALGVGGFLVYRFVWIPKKLPAFGKDIMAEDTAQNEMASFFEGSRVATIPKATQTQQQGQPQRPAPQARRPAPPKPKSRKAASSRPKMQDFDPFAENIFEDKKTAKSGNLRSKTGGFKGFKNLFGGKKR